MKINIDPKKIEEVLSRGVENIYPSRQALENVLLSGEKLRIYSGIDPTGKLHLGHLVVLRKLRQFQDLGHEIIILIGDFTAAIGDPTGKSAARKPLSAEQISKNAKNYKKQIGRILNLTKSNVRFLRNEKWTNKLKPKDMLELASHFTVARLLERDMFQVRIKKGQDILVHEFLYPIFQAYDSLTMDVDMEVGGNDQTFNMLAGRRLMKKLKNKEKFVLTTRLLVDAEGKKMGKTEGNMINLDEKPKEMYGKIMNWPDSLLNVGLELCTAVSLKEIKEISEQIKQGGINPKEVKARLAREIVRLYYGEKKAEEAEKEFTRVFKEKKLPSKIPEMKIKENSLNILELLVKTKMASSKSEAKRLILQKGVKINRVLKENWQEIIEINLQKPKGFCRINLQNPSGFCRIKTGILIQVGKRRFVKAI